MLAEITPSELQQIIVGAVRDAVSNEMRLIAPQINHPIKEKDAYLTRQEVCELLKISLPTLNTYTKDGVINAYRLGRSVRYKKNDIAVSMQPIRNKNYRK